jgi:hypothetical protein
MIRRQLILSVLFTVFPLISFPQDHNIDIRLRVIVNRDRQAMVAIPYPGVIAAGQLSHYVSVETVKDKKLVIFLSPLTVEWFIRQGYNYIIEDISDSKGIVSAVSLSQAMEWNSYPTYTQYDSILQSFVSNYPSLCRIDTIGKTNNGKLLLALKISDNAGAKEDEPEVFYSSSIHGNETGGFVLMLRLADYLLKNYGQNSRVRNLVDNLEIWINPLANPDGTYVGGNSITNPVRFNANGKDLNRNFPDPETHLVTPEKETSGMVSFMKKHRFVISANFHSGDEVVNYPWDRWPRLHADDEWFRIVSRKYADTVHINSPAGYMTFLDNGVTNGYEWYSVNGGRQDFVTYSLHGREVTIELDDNFITPVTQLGQLWDNNRNSLLGYLENALYGIHGTVTDTVTHKPVAARIFIQAHDSDSSDVYSGKLTGSFTRLLAPGMWNLSFSAPGYYETRAEAVVSEPEKQTILNIKMIPFSNSVDTTSPGEPFLYPNPAVNEIKAVLPLAIHGSLNISIVNSLGSVVSVSDIESFPNTPVILSLRRLSAGAYTVVFLNKSAGISCKGRFIVVKN